MILGFNFFEFGPSKPELRHFSFSTLGKILVLRVLPAFRKKFWTLLLKTVEIFIYFIPNLVISYNNFALVFL